LPQAAAEVQVRPLDPGADAVFGAVAGAQLETTQQVFGHRDGDGNPRRGAAFRWRRVDVGKLQRLNTAEAPLAADDVALAIHIVGPECQLSSDDVLADPCVADHRDVAEDGDGAGGGRHGERDGAWCRTGRFVQLDLRVRVAMIEQRLAHDPHDFEEPFAIARTAGVRDVRPKPCLQIDRQVVDTFEANRLDANRLTFVDADPQSNPVPFFVEIGRNHRDARVGIAARLVQPGDADEVFLEGLTVERRTRRPRQDAARRGRHDRPDLLGAQGPLPFDLEPQDMYPAFVV